MKLFTKDIDRQLFKQFHLGNDLDNQVVVTKIFNPYANMRWFIVNSDVDDSDYLWAIVQMGNNVEVGSVSRSELETIRISPFRLPLERDLGFRPVNAGELLRGLRQGKFYKKGGWVENENKEMVENQANEVKHHSEELSNALKNTDHVEAWVVGKMERATTDLSDVTHYLDGESKKMAKGGSVDKYSFEVDSADVVGSDEKFWGGNVFKNGEGVVFIPFGYNSKEEVEKRAKNIIEELKEGTFKGFNLLDNKYFRKYRMADGGMMADGGAVKGRNDKTGESFGVVIGSIKKSDDYIDGGTEMNVRKSYGSRIGEVKLIFDNKDNLHEVIDYGYSVEGYPSTSGGSGRKYNYDKKETIKFLSEMYSPSFAKKIIERVSVKMADGGEVNKYAEIFDKLKKGDKVEMTFGSGSFNKNKAHLLVKSKNIVGKGKSYESEKITFENVRNPQGVKFYAYKRKSGYVGFAMGDMAISDVQISFADKMAKGGGVKDRSERDSIRLAKEYQKVLDSNFDDKVYEKYQILVKDTQIPKSDLQKIEHYISITPKSKRRDIDIYRYWGIDKMADGGVMKKGGMSNKKVTFDDKVKAIQSSLLKRKKVSPKVQEDYGKTYSRKEALQSAKRIAGSMRKKGK